MARRALIAVSSLLLFVVSLAPAASAHGEHDEGGGLYHEEFSAGSFEGAIWVVTEADETTGDLAALVSVRSETTRVDELMLRVWTVDEQGTMSGGAVASRHAQLSGYWEAYISNGSHQVLVQITDTQGGTSEAVVTLGGPTVAFWAKALLMGVAALSAWFTVWIMRAGVAIWRPARLAMQNPA